MAADAGADGIIVSNHGGTADLTAASVEGCALVLPIVRPSFHARRATSGERACKQLLAKFNA
jgi:isopentenyl diphosphate isomerase/L-lactate dehydrogenase-like FMN-dependent dehydrogenase